jgi:hypothetical protein
MAKLFLLLKEMVYMVKKYKLYFLAPLLLMLVLLACIVFYLGPSIIITFIYAGL